MCCTLKALQGCQESCDPLRAGLFRALQVLLSLVETSEPLVLTPRKSLCASMVKSWVLTVFPAVLQVLRSTEVCGVL